MNSLGEGLFEKARKSFDRSPALAAATFKQWGFATVEGQRAVVLKIDRSRFDHVMSAMAYGLYYRDYQTRYLGVWKIVAPTMMGSHRHSATPFDALNAMARQMLGQPRVIHRDTGNPDVFRYAAYSEGEGKIVYGFWFYNGLDVYALGILDEST
ncbi:MAG TPA: hypothetical protein VJX67_24185 [Blastocatellia bacterium]|nr:hypothetical protein [Blastocatellia bacterium]